MPEISINEDVPDDWRLKKPPYRARTAPSTQRRRRMAQFQDEASQRVNRKRKTMDGGMGLENDAGESNGQPLSSSNDSEHIHEHQSASIAPPKPHPFSARVQFRRSPHDATAISRDQQHSNRRRGFALSIVEPEIISEVTFAEETPTSVVSSFSQYSNNISPTHSTSPGELTFPNRNDDDTPQSFTPKRASSSAMMFHSSASQFMRDSPFSGGLGSNGATSSLGLRHRGSSTSLDLNTSSESGKDLFRGFSATAPSGLSSSATGDRYSFTGPLPTPPHQQHIGGKQSFRRRYFVNSEPSSTPTANTRPRTQKESSLPNIRRPQPQAAPTNVQTKSVSRPLPRTHNASSAPHLMQTILLLDHESRELERQHRYFDAIQKMQECIGVMKEVYGSWRHEQIAQYVERCVAMCNTYAHHYMYGSSFGGQTRARSKHDTPITDPFHEADMSAAHELLKTALRFCSEQSPFQFTSKPVLLIVTWNNLASFFRKLNKLDRAHKYARKAYDYKRRKESAKPNKNIMLADNPAGVELNLGAILSLMGHHHESLKFSRMALNILLDEDLLIDDMHRLFPDEHTRRKTFPLFSSLVIVHHNIAVELEHLNKLDEAFRWHVKAVTIARSKLGDNSELTKEMQFVLEEFERVCRQVMDIPVSHVQGSLLLESIPSDVSQSDIQTPGSTATMLHRFQKSHRLHTSQPPHTPGIGSSLIENSLSAPDIASSVHTPIPGAMQWDQMSTISMTSIVHSDPLHTELLPSRDLVILDDNTTGPSSFSPNKTSDLGPATGVRPTPPSTLTKSSSHVRRIASSKPNKQKTQQIKKKGSQSDKLQIRVRKTKSSKRLAQVEKIYTSKKFPKPPSAPPGSSNAHSFQRKFKSTILARPDASQLPVSTWADATEIMSEHSAVQSGKASSISKQLLYIQQREMATHHDAALMIQNAWRVYSAKQHATRRRAFVIMFSALSIQSFYRGSLVRRKLRGSMSAAVTIQSWYRLHRARRMYLRHSTAAIRIQRAFRGWMVIREKILRRWSALRLQSVLRSFMQRCQTQKMMQSAIVIQRSWRRTEDRIRLEQLTRAAVLMQRLWRKKLLSKLVRQQFRLHLMVLKWWKMRKARLLHEKHIASAVILQRWWRLRRDAGYYLELQWACSVVQPQTRMMIVRQSFVNLQRSVACLQSHHRRRHVMRQVHVMHGAAHRIARHWRMYNTRKQLRRMLHSTMVIQRTVRLHQTRSALSKRSAAVTQIQACWRKFLALEDYQAKQNAVLPIQRAWRRYSARKRLRDEINAQIVLARAWRVFACHKHREMQDTAASKIQSLYRGVLSRRYHTQFVEPTTKLQATVRSMIARIQLRKQQDAALVISRIFRMYSTQRMLKQQRDTVELIQRWTRFWLSVKYVQRLREAARRESAALRIQSWWRACSEQIQQEISHNASILLQSWARRFVYQIRYRRMQTNAVAVQRVWLGYKVRLDLRKIGANAALVQSWWRMQIEMEQMQRKRRAAIVIQRFIRWRQCRMNAVVRIQAMWRSYASRKHMREEDALVAKIQHVWMQYRRRKHSRIVRSVVNLGQ